MFANAKVLLVIASCALAVQAQSSGSPTTTAPASQSSLPAGLDSCIVSCVSAAAASNGCVSFTNLTCTCTSTAFQQDALQCLNANCTSSDVATATQLQEQECGSLTNSTGSGSSAPASTGASTSAASAKPSTSSNAAVALSAPFSLGSLVGTLVASAGALVGAAFIL